MGIKIKPLKLTMSAFGSYIKKTEIDFTLFGDKGIYLITGDTGSGKTTIFDALTYALFGSGSGELRNSSSAFRSKYADIYDDTFVELEFLYNNEIYTVKRNPEYKRAKKIGEGGITKQKLSAFLTMPSGRTISGDTLVSKEISNLLGIDKNQFSQIVMLPQGSFMKFLMAGTAEKQKIFQDIFKTHLYKVLQENINNDAIKYKNEIDNQRKILCSAVNEIICPQESKAYNEISEIKGTLIESDNPAADIILENINTIKNEQLELKNIKENSLEELNKTIDNINKEIGICKTNNDLKNKIEKENNVIKKEKALLAELEKNLENAEKSAEICPKLHIQIDGLEKQFPKYDERDKLIKEYKTLEKNIQNFENEIEKEKNIIEENKNNIYKFKDELTELRDIDKTEIELNNYSNQLKNKLEGINSAFDKLKSYMQENEKLEKEQKKLKKIILEYEKFRDEFIKKEKLYDNAIAGILAEKLEENQMCPVCGSTEHPKTAVKPKSTPTEQELEESKEKFLIKENEKNICREKVNGVKVRSETILENLIDDAEKIFDKKITDVEYISENLQIKRDKIQNEITENNDQLKRISDKKKRRNKIEDSIKKCEEENSNIEKNIEEKEKEHKKNREKAVVLRTKIDSIKLDFDNYKSAESECSKLKRTKNSLETALKSANEKYENCKRKILDAETAVKTAKEQINSSSKSNIKELEDHLNKLNKKRGELISDLNNINHILETNNDKEKKIKNFKKNIGNKNEKYKYIKELSDLVNGKIKKLGADQITLEVRVQMVYFERIIRKANIHLLNMTDGQYELVRNLESTDKRAKFGLDLNILDHFNQSYRDVKTLSGGESFKASLALALGMSDEIQSNSGGIQMDSFFVDEGFGSLDDESLNQAINTLNSLVKSNRLIGIISHVSELKNRIDKKIIVSKDNYSGSSVKIEY